MHLMHQIDAPCALNDGHGGRCRTRQAYARQMAKHAEVNARWRARNPVADYLSHVRDAAKRRAA